MSTYKSVEKQRHQTRHGIHFVLTICTLGVWAVTGWPLFLLWNKIRPRKRIVTKTQVPAPMQFQPSEPVAPAPGWYSVPGGLSYWDGRQWGQFTPRG